MSRGGKSRRLPLRVIQVASRATSQVPWYEVRWMGGNMGRPDWEPGLPIRLIEGESVDR